MNNGLTKVICLTSVLALIVAFGAPQGKRKGGTGGGGTTTSGGSTGSRSTTGGGSSGGSTGGSRQGPPQRTTTTGGTSGGGGGTTSGGGPGRRNEPPPQRTTTGGGTSGGGGGTVNRGGGTGGSTGGSRGGSGIGGRIERDGDTGRTVISGGGQGLGNRGQSRSGVVRYGTINNQIDRDRNTSRVRIERPGGIINPGMQRRINDQERVGLVYNGWRVGYYHYDRRWNDDYYRYPFYLFNPWQADRYVCSPWYYYPSCPPYLNSTRIIVINAGWPSYNWSGQSYRWNRPDRNDRWNQYNDLDYAIDDMVNAFERRDLRSLDRLVPRNGNVHMYFDGRYGYSLDVRDFYDLYLDGIENVRTSRYDVLDVQQNGRNARVLAKHEFLDPWGQRAYTYHQYFLERDGRDWVIREFGTSNQRPW